MSSPAHKLFDRMSKRTRQKETMLGFRGGRAMGFPGVWDSNAHSNQLAGPEERGRFESLKHLWEMLIM